MTTLQRNFGYWEFWEPYNPSVEIGPGAPAFGTKKVIFDGPNRLIIVAEGTTSLSVQLDIYSAWKDWVEVRDNAKYVQALTAVGGDPITDTQAVGITYFLENGWRIKMWEGDHQLDVTGNLYTRESGGDPYIEPDGNYKVTISTNRSNLVDIITTTTGAVSNDDITLIANSVWQVPKSQAGAVDGSIGDHVANDLLTRNKFIALDE